MNTERVRADGPAVGRAAELLSAGEVVAFPTETVYGLGADATNSMAVAKIFAAKGRPEDNPLIVHIADPNDLEAIAELAPGGIAHRLRSAFWPGPLTLVLPAKSGLAANALGGLSTVAVRMPSHPIALDLIRALGRPVAAPSANRSGRPSPTDADAVCEDLNGRIAMVLDGGPTDLGLESTVVDCTSSPPVILRPGSIARRDILEVTGSLGTADGDQSTRSPGTRYRHYAPRARVVRVAAAQATTLRERAELAGGPAIDPRRTGVLALDEVLRRLVGWPGPIYSLGGNVSEAARRFFRGLRTLDRPSTDVIAVVWDDDQGLGEALFNRLTKAEGKTVDGTVLFVCTGNTCRSAMAEALWNLRYPELTARSAGVAALSGAPASPAALRAIRAIWPPADLEQHRSRRVDEVLDDPAWVVTMTDDQTEWVKALRPEWSDRVASLSRWATGRGGDVSDPYGSSDAAYEALARRIDELLPRLWQVLSERMSKNA